MDKNYCLSNIDMYINGKDPINAPTHPQKSKLLTHHSDHRSHIRIQNKKKSMHALTISQRTFKLKHVSSRDVFDGFHYVVWYTDMKG